MKTGNHPNMTEKLLNWDVKHQHKQTRLDISTCMYYMPPQFLSNLKHDSSYKHFTRSVRYSVDPDQLASEAS